MTTSRENVDAAEVAKFDALASRWWDPNGDFRPLHEINPLRLDWIRQHVSLSGAKVVDIGCGGGILTEAMAAANANVTGVDMAEAPLAVARLHQHESKLDIDYRQATAEQLAESEAASYDVVTCLEMLEHVPDPAAVINACYEEYVLKLLPAGTHEYEKFIRPSELETWARHAGLSHQDSIGLHYNPFTKDYSLRENLDVNYLMYFQRD